MRLNLCVALMLAISMPAAAQLRDVGLVNLVSGDVRFVPVNGANTPVKPFMRVREGDRFTLPAGAQLRVVFFEGSRQERWAGPAGFRAARAQAEPIAGAPAEVTQLPAGTPQRIARIPDLMQNAKLGGVQARGAARSEAAAPPSGTPEEARAAYEEMRRALPPDDVTPELYYYAALQEHGRYDEMRAVVDEMQRKQPESADVKTLADWVKKKTGG